MEKKENSVVGKPIRKKDAMALLCGKPVYVDRKSTRLNSSHM